MQSSNKWNPPPKVVSAQPGFYYVGPVVDANYTTVIGTFELPIIGWLVGVLYRSATDDYFTVNPLPVSLEGYPGNHALYAIRTPAGSYEMPADEVTLQTRAEVIAYFQENRRHAAERDDSSGARPAGLRLVECDGPRLKK